MIEKYFEKKNLISFDKTYSADVFIKHPDKYKQLEIDSQKKENLISRGGGYSYSAASFKKESLSIGMKNFNRILYFDKEKQEITIESGITFIELLNFTLKYGLWITQIPGYPFITLGGAVAANVHGKSCSSDGTIRNVIKNILIFHKNHGWLNLSKDENKNIFDLTIGGFGLTGTIVSLTIKLVKLEGLNFITSVKKTKSISDTIDLIKDSKSKNLLAYSWNRVDPNLKNFGEGLVFYNKIEKNKEKIDLELSNFNSFHFFMNKINLCLWNKVTIKTFNYFFLNYYRYLKKDNYIDNFSNAIFPFRGKEMYFSLFGKKGFYESQILVSHEVAQNFIEELRKAISIYKPTITLFSIKEMQGNQEYLRFEGNMTLLTFDVTKNNKNSIFMDEVDKLCIKYNAIPSIIKDSRLKREVLDKCYKFADKFREELKNFDSKRFYKSELSDRLNL